MSERDYQYIGPYLVPAFALHRHIARGIKHQHDGGALSHAHEEGSPLLDPMYERQP